MENTHQAHGVCGSCGNGVHRYPFGWQHVGTGMYSCPAIDPQATCCPEHAQQDGEQPHVPSHEAEAREYMAEQVAEGA